MLLIQNPKSKIQNGKRAFTLLELLAAVTLLVVLGTMLFQVFHQASQVVEIASARQEVYQYARAALEFLEREMNGAFTGVDANVNAGIKGMRIFDQGGMGSACPKRELSQGIFFTTGIMARDTSGTSATNPNFGRDVNCARVAYYLNDETQKLRDASIRRVELYDLTAADPGTGGPTETGSAFVRNCLRFNIEIVSHLQNSDPVDFLALDWNSDANVTVGGFTRRRGLPQALRLTLRITDERRAMLYEWGTIGGEKKWYVPGPDPVKDYWGEEDPVVQTFRQTIYYGRRSD